MFCVIDLWKNVCVKPTQLSSKFEEVSDWQVTEQIWLFQHVGDLLRNEVEGKCLGKYGYIVCVVRILSREKGRIQDGTGHVVVPVKYQAVVFQPLRGEVMDGSITSVNAVGFFAQCGPVKAFVSKANFPSDYEMIEGIWTDGESRLQADTQVRLRILGFKYETNGMVITANSRLTNVHADCRCSNRPGLPGTARFGRYIACVHMPGNKSRRALASRSVWEVSSSSKMVLPYEVQQVDHQPIWLGNPDEEKVRRIPHVYLGISWDKHHSNHHGFGFLKPKKPKGH